jgi:hypothetical protein
MRGWVDGRERVRRAEGQKHAYINDIVVDVWEGSNMAVGEDVQMIQSYSPSLILVTASPSKVDRVDSTDAVCAPLRTDCVTGSNILSTDSI